MRNHSYTLPLKILMALLQLVCIGIMTVSLILIHYWTDGTYDLSELGRSFEQTQIFLNDVEETVRSKIENTQNEALFETGGETDLTRLIDIRQYVNGYADSANINENTAYTLSDLISFDAAALAKVIAQEEAGELKSGRTWDALTALASEHETILPASGRTLSDTARSASDPYGTLLEYYSELCETSADVSRRYEVYQESRISPDGTASEEAPSNVAYYIESTTTRQSYTNMEAASCSEARDLIGEDDSLTFLFDGVRTLDIMVATDANTLNEEAADKFIDTVFLGSNERVIIAVNESYPAGDVLHSDYQAYLQREPVVHAALISLAAGAVLLLLLLGLSVTVAGRRDPDTLIALRGIDTIPAEIAAGIAVAVGLTVYYAANALLEPGMSSWPRSVVQVMFAMTEYAILLACLLSLVRRMRWHTLWTNSVTYTVIRVSASVIEARITSRRLLFIYLIFVLMHFLFLRYFRAVGVVIVLILDMALLLYLMRDQVGKISVRKGLREISKGDLDYKIDTSSLTGDSLEMAGAVNEMGDGLKQAVESMVKSERLKAELITNVSHDLKTPLTSIINYVGLLKQEDIGNGKAREYVEVLDDKSQRLKALISDLIDASRISSGNVKLENTQIDLRQMVLMAVGEYEDRFEEEDLHVNMELGEGDAFILADGSWLWRVLDNLLGNIAKYAKSGSCVDVRLEKADRQLSAIFENEPKVKIEMSGEELEERFVRGDLSRSSEGSGLGLSIAKNLTQLMGGEFCVSTQEDLFSARVSFPPVNS